MKFQVKRDIDKRIKELTSHFFRRKVSFLWIVHPTSLPLDLSDRLQQYGLLNIEIAPCMARNLINLPQMPLLPDGVEVHEVVEESDVNESLELAAWRWGVPPNYHQQLKAVLECFNIGKPGSKTRMWLACRSTVTIAKIGTCYGEKSVGIYGLVTKPEERGQGLASILMVEAMKAAREVGKKLAALHSSPLAEKLYKWLGIVTVTQFNLYASEKAYL
jgi:GNAT superfamily N-acetyltransferase